MDKIYDRFVAGEISIDEYSSFINESSKVSSMRGQKHTLNKTAQPLGRRNFKRLSEFFAQPTPEELEI